MDLQFQQKNAQTWEAFKNRIGKKKEIYQFLSNKKPGAAETVIFGTKTKRFYPELSGIIVHQDKNRTMYETREGALEAAKKISSHIVAALKNPNTNWRYS